MGAGYYQSSVAPNKDRLIVVPAEMRLLAVECFGLQK